MFTEAVDVDVVVACSVHFGKLYCLSHVITLCVISHANLENRADMAK
jgi:hypothetical protein